MARLIKRNPFIVKFAPGGKFNLGQYTAFVSLYYPLAYQYGLSRGLSPELALLWARHSTYLVAHESGYGSHVGGSYNYGGMRANGRYLNYGSMEDFVKGYGDNMYNKWKDAFYASDIDAFSNSIHTPSAFYSTRGNGAGYASHLKGVRNRVDKIINGIQL